MNSSGNDPTSARGLFGSELRRLRELRRVSQRGLASMVVHSRGLIAEVELGQRWPPHDLAVRSDEVLGGGGALIRLWPLVEAERQAAREILAGVRLLDLRTLVLRLAAATGADLSVLAVADSDTAAEAGSD